MGFFDLFSKIFKKKTDSSVSKRFKSDLNQENYEMTKEFETIKNPVESQTTQQLTLDQDSVQLGVAAGYTGRSIREIESSLTRIESQMVSKDWLLLKLGEQQNIFENLSQRLDAIYNLLVERLAKKIEYRESGLTDKMAHLISIIKKEGQISYEDLAARLNITISALRGLLSNTTRRNDALERFTRSNKGWVKYIGDDLSASNQSDQLELSGEKALAVSFEKIIEGLGYKIVERNANKAPDYVLEKDGKRIGVELKVSATISSIELGIGQLLMAKTEKSLEEMWLIFPHQKVAQNMLETIKSMGMRVYFILENQLVETS